MADKLKSLIKNYAPDLLTGVSIASSLCAICATAKNSIKAKELYEKKKKEYEDEKIPGKEIFKIVAGNYWQTFILEGLSIGSSLGSNSISHAKYDGLAMVATMADIVHREVSEAADSVLPKKQKDQIADKYAEKQIEKANGSEDIVYETGKGPVLCIEPYTGMKFRSTAADIKDSAASLKELIIKCDEAELSDFLMELGLPNSKAAEYFYWSHEDGLPTISTRYMPISADNAEPIIVIDYGWNKPKIRVN